MYQEQNLNVPFKFGVDSSGNYGYIKAGADTVTPFLTRTGNATASHVLSGKTFSNASSSGLTGTMTNNGAVSKTITPSMSTQTYTIPAGYHNGSGKVTVKAVDTVYEPVSLSGQTRVTGTPVLTKTISFGKTFAIVPNVVISYVNGWKSDQQYDVTGWTTVTKVTTTNFTVKIGAWTASSYNHDITWAVAGLVKL